MCNLEFFFNAIGGDNPTVYQFVAKKEKGNARDSQQLFAECFPNLCAPRGVWNGSGERSNVEKFVEVDVSTRVCSFYCSTDEGIADAQAEARNNSELGVK